MRTGTTGPASVSSVSSGWLRELVALLIAVDREPSAAEFELAATVVAAVRRFG